MNLVMKSFEKAKDKLYCFTNTGNFLLFLKDSKISVEMFHLFLLRTVCFSHLSGCFVYPKISPGIPNPILLMGGFERNGLCPFERVGSLWI